MPWYIEGFINFTGEAFERFAQRSRVLVGVGYIFNRKFRGEFLHITQRSRNTVEGEFVASDFIFWLLVRYYP